MKNKNFILQPVESILEEMQLSTARLSADFNTLPVYNYILQAVLLKMTGFMVFQKSEQGHRDPEKTLNLLYT